MMGAATHKTAWNSLIPDKRDQVKTKNGKMFVEISSSVCRFYSLRHFAAEKYMRRKANKQKKKASMDLTRAQETNGNYVLRDLKRRTNEWMNERKDFLQNSCLTMLFTRSVIIIIARCLCRFSFLVRARLLRFFDVKGKCGTRNSSRVLSTMKISRKVPFSTMKMVYDKKKTTKEKSK